MFATASGPLTPRILNGLLLTTAVLAVTVPSLSAHAQAAYRWKDAEGRVHFSDRPPPTGDAQQIELQKTPSVQAEPVRDRTPPPREGAAGGLEVVPDDSRKSRAEMSCKERWAEYFKSQECFAPYQRVGTGPRVEAYEKCVEVTSPESDCGAPENFPESTQ